MSAVSCLPHDRAAANTHPPPQATLGKYEGEGAASAAADTSLHVKDYKY
jgi:hypothetical protein